MFGTSLHEKKLSRASPDDMGKTKNVTNKQQISAPSQTELQILFVLHNKKNDGVYGLDIKKAIDFCSGENEELSLGTLYSLLKRLRSKGFICSYDGSSVGGGANRKYYRLTDIGTSEVKRISKFYEKLQKWTPSG